MGHRRTWTTYAFLGIPVCIALATLGTGCEFIVQIGSSTHEEGDAGSVGPEAAPQVDGDVGGDTDAHERDDADTDSDTDSDHEVEWLCSHHVCDLWPQCGCLYGERCVNDEYGSRLCAPAGPIGHGGECDLSGEGCALGTVCSGAVDQPGYCLQYCNEEADCDGRGQGSRCVIQIQGATGATVATACSLNCDPAALAPACAVGVRCDIFHLSGGDEVHTHCFGFAGDGAGSPCETHADCAAGYFCADDYGTSRCWRRCTFGVGVECTLPEHCVAFDNPQIVGSTEYGYCI